jgi:small subunit ribosomal protein S3
VGHKVHPNGFRLGVYRSWEANWFAEDRDYTKLLHEDLEMRRLILRRLQNAGIAKIETERSSNAQMTVTIHTAKPGIVIGKGGSSVDQLREDLEKRFKNRVRISIQEIKQPELDAQLVAENIASQIERRISYRRAMKQSILRTMRAGAQGVRIALAGRLRGSEMARREWDREGRVPLHTLRANIDFGRATARTTFGVIGVKVWLYKGLVAVAPRGGDAAAAAVEAAARPAPEPPAPVAARERTANAAAVREVPTGTHAEAPDVSPASQSVAVPTVERQEAQEKVDKRPVRRRATTKPAPEGTPSVTPEDSVPAAKDTPIGEAGEGGADASS